MQLTAVSAAAWGTGSTVAPVRVLGSNWTAFPPPSTPTQGPLDGHDTEASGVVPSTEVGPALSFWVVVIVVGSNVAASAIGMGSAVQSPLPHIQQAVSLRNPTA